MDDFDGENENSYNIDRHVLITARIHKFSNEAVHVPGSERCTVYSKRVDNLRYNYKPEVFANGYIKANKGFVCVGFNHALSDIALIGNCLFSVIDVADNQRFSQSFIISTDNESERYTIIQYISRKTLLDNPDEYLPNDVLRLRIEAYFAVRSVYVPVFVGTYKGTLYEYKFMYTKLNDDTYEFELNSPFAKRLAEESSFFRGVLRAPMIEKSTETMLIDKKEYESFYIISHMFMEQPVIFFRSVEELFDLCIVADKYDIPTGTELCTCFLKLCLFDHTVDDYLDIINKKYDSFKEVLVNLISLVKDTDIDKEMVKERGGVRLKRPIRKRIWFYKKGLNNLKFEIVEKPTSRPHETFDFYN